MTDQTPKAALDRRRFLLGVGAGAAAVATIQVGTAEPAHAYDPGPEETKARYRETDHVKAYYRVNGYE
ncbi:MAG: twin-arginine translocation signal domain-containing protein [Rhodomicrobiaceae bacterium]